MKKVIVVGAGLAGLTAAVYLSKAGHNVTLIEKSDKCGGLITSFNNKGFVFDTGARSIENAGIIKPMLKDLGINLELLKSPVSIGIKNKVINVSSINDLLEYKKLLEELYPESKKDIQKIIEVIKKTLQDMKVLYGIDNPSFKDLKKTRNSSRN